MAVFAVIGSSPATRAETGVTAATGLAERMMNSPMVAFQKPITDHGSVIANNTTRMKSITPKPPAVSANDNSEISPTIEASTIRVKNTRRPASGSAAFRSFPRKRESRFTGCSGSPLSRGRAESEVCSINAMGAFSDRAGYSGRLAGKSNSGSIGGSEP